MVSGAIPAREGIQKASTLPEKLIPAGAPLGPNAHYGSILRRQDSIATESYLFFGFVAAFVDFWDCSLEVLVFGLAGLFAFVLAAAFFSFTGGSVLGAAFAGGATGAGSLAAVLLAATGALFWGSAVLAGMAGTGGMTGDVTAGAGFFAGAGVAALVGGTG